MRTAETSVAKSVEQSALLMFYVRPMRRSSRTVLLERRRTRATLLYFTGRYASCGFGRADDILDVAPPNPARAVLAAMVFFFVSQALP